MTASSPARRILWSEMTWPELRQASLEGYLVIIPVGSIEQHGPHLPVDTDAHCAYEIAKRAAERMDRVLVAPVVAPGFSPEHKGFPGTIYLRLETMVNLLTDICHAIVSHGFRKIVLFNGHGGNSDLLRAVAREFLRTHGIAVACADHWAFAAKRIASIRKSGSGGMDHADEMETALQLFLRPKLVRAGARANYGDPLPRGETSFSSCDNFAPGTVYVPRDYALTEPEGHVGDPTVATAETGRLILEAELEELVAFLKEFHEATPQKAR